MDRLESHWRLTVVTKSQWILRSTGPTGVSQRDYNAATCGGVPEHIKSIHNISSHAYCARRHLRVVPEHIEWEDVESLLARLGNGEEDFTRYSQSVQMPDPEPGVQLGPAPRLCPSSCLPFLPSLPTPANRGLPSFGPSPPFSLFPPSLSFSPAS